MLSLPSGHAMLKQRLMNAAATSWHCTNVDAKLYRRQVPTAQRVYNVEQRRFKADSTSRWDDVM